MKYLVVGEGSYSISVSHVDASSPEEAARKFDADSLDGGTVRVFGPDEGVTFDVDVDVKVSVRERAA